MKSFALLSLAIVLAAPAQSLRAEVVDEIVIKVNDAVVTKSEFDKRLKSTRDGMRREYKGPDVEQRIQQMPQLLLEQMEDELLLVEKAKQVYQVDAIVDGQIENFMKDNKLNTKDDLAKALAGEGMTMEEFHKQVLLIYVPEFMKSREIRSKISVSTDEIKEFYEKHKNEMAGKPQVQLQEILVLKKGHTQEDADALAAQVRKEMAAGKNFGDLAVQYSEAFSKSNKGEAGWFKVSELSPDISKAVSAVEVGGVTDPIATSAGWYIFRVEARKTPDVPSLDKAREGVIEAIKEEKFQKAYKDYIAELKAQNYVRVNPKYL
jgi:peptidyl-prolyl cis-trans isomerase SurA